MTYVEPPNALRDALKRASSLIDDALQDLHEGNDDGADDKAHEIAKTVRDAASKVGLRIALPVSREHAQGMLKVAQFYLESHRDHSPYETKICETCGQSIPPF